MLRSLVGAGVKLNHGSSGPVKARAAALLHPPEMSSETYGTRAHDLA